MMGGASPLLIAAPVLIALAPLAAALIAFALKRFTGPWAIASLALAGAAGLALVKALTWKFADRFDEAGGALGFLWHPAALIVAPALTVCAALAMLSSGAWMGARVRASAATATLFCMSAFGWIAAALSEDFAPALGYLFTAWFAACALTATHGAHDRAALSSALRMVLVGAFQAALLCLGAAILMRLSGAVGFTELAMAPTPMGPIGAVGFTLVALGLSGFAGLSPSQGWSAGALSRGDHLAGLALSVLAPVSALSLLIRFFAATAVHADQAVAAMATLGALGGLSVVYASVQAIGSRDMRRMAGYALAAQGGCLLVGLSIGGAVAVAAALMQLLNIAIVSLAFFAGAAIVLDSAKLEALEGLGRRAPLAGASIAIGALSLIGAPLTFGFLVRWRLIEAALQSAVWWAAAAQVAASLAAVVYAGRVLERLYLRPSKIDLISRSPWRVALAPALAAPIAAAIGLGLNASVVWNAALHAGERLTAAAP